MAITLREYSEQLHREISQGLGNGYGPEGARRTVRTLEEMRPSDRFAQFRDAKPAVVVDLSQGAVRAWEEAKAERAARLAGQAGENDEARKEERPYGLSEELLTLTDEEMEAIRGPGEPKNTGKAAGGKKDDGGSAIDQLKEKIKEAEQRLTEAQEELSKVVREAQGEAGSAATDAKVRAAQDKVSAAQSELQQLNTQLGEMQAAG